MKKLIDRYLQWPLFFDSLIVICFDLLYTILKGKIKWHVEFERANLLSLISNIIGTCVSLSGFILAALTIIVTFKSNLKVKGIEESENALELIFSSKHYESIVCVYKDAIFELVIISIALYLIWFVEGLIDDKVLSIITACSIFLLSTTVVRSLIVLFTILSLDKHTQSKKAGN